MAHIHALKNKADYMIVLYHGGKEHYRYPSPYLQKVCRKIVDIGASLVVCQHNHCIGCTEDWNDGTIVYGQGNFLFDRSDSEFWQTSLLINLNIGDKYHKLDPIITYVPLEKRGIKCRKADNLASEKIFKDFFACSKEIATKEFAEYRYREFSEEMQWEYLNACAGRITKRLFPSSYKSIKWL